MSKAVPQNKKLWSRAIAEAKKRFRVYPSAYANAWASKFYKRNGGSWQTESVDRSGRWDITHKDIDGGRMLLIHHPSGRHRVLDKAKAKKVNERIDQINRLWSQSSSDVRPAPFKNVHKHIDHYLTQCCMGHTVEDLQESYRGGLRKWFRERWVDISRNNKDGSHPACGASADDKDRKGGGAKYPKCRPATKASRMTDDEKAASVRRKRAEGAPPGKPRWVK